MCSDFDLSNRENMVALQAALATKGLSAAIEDGGNGILVLTLPLLADNGTAALSVTALSVGRPCEIGLSGYRRVGKRVVNCGSVGFAYPKTIDLAADVMQLYWRDRDVFIRDLREGRCDLE